MSKKIVGVILIVIGVLFMISVIMTLNDEPKTDGNNPDNYLAKVLIALLSLGLVWFGARMMRRKK